MKRCFLFATVFVLFCCVLPTQAQAAHLSPGQGASGALDHTGDSITYTFDLPAKLDMVVNFSSDKTIWPTYCLVINGAAQCQSRGGGGGDDPVVRVFDIPASDTAQTVELTLTRFYDGTAHYQFKTSSLTAGTLDLDDSASVNADSPYQSYLVIHDPTQPLVVEIEDAQAAGQYLWVAYQPPLFPVGLALSDKPVLFPEYVDEALGDNTDKGVAQLELNYLGGHEFQVFIVTYGAFLLHARSLDVQPLEAGRNLLVTLSYRDPLYIVRLDTKPGETVQVNGEVEQGKGADVGIYYDSSIDDRAGMTLGLDSLVSPTPSPFSNTTSFTAKNEQPVYASVHLPNNAPRELVDVQINWQPAT